MKGQSSVEMALALPALVLLLVVVADFARVFYVATEVASAARAGAQYGAQSYTAAIDNTGMVRAALNDGQNISSLPESSANPTGAGLTANANHFCMCNGATVDCAAPPSSCTEPQLFVQVTTNATFPTLLKYPGVPSRIPLSYTAVMEAQKGG